MNVCVVFICFYQQDSYACVILDLNETSHSVTDPAATLAAVAAAQAPAAEVPVVIPGADSLLGDLLDINPPVYHPPQSVTPTPQNNDVDLLGEGLDSLVCVC